MNELAAANSLPRPFVKTYEESFDLFDPTRMNLDRSHRIDTREIALRGHLIQPHGTNALRSATQREEEGS